MLSIAFALAAAVLYGTSDFLGGLLSRRAHFIPVTFLTSVGATLAGLVALLIAGPTALPAATLAWGLLAGVCGGIGTLALFRGLAGGQMAVVGPISALGAAILPAVVGLMGGERLSLVAGLGVLVALPAIWLVATPNPPDDPAGGVNDESPAASTATPARSRADAVLDGIVAGAGFGMLFVGVKHAGSNAGLWPAFLSEAGTMIPALGMLGWTVLARRGNPQAARDLWEQPSTLRLAWLPGALAMSAVLAYQWSVHSGPMSVAAVVTSLYPGVTVVLAAVFLHEKTSVLQRLGLAVGAVAVLAIALG